MADEQDAQLNEEDGQQEESGPGLVAQLLGAPKQLISTIKSLPSKGTHPVRTTDYWQVPALGLAAAAVAAGVVTGIKTAPGHDFEGALNSVQYAIEDNQYEQALLLLNDPLGRFIYDEGVNPTDLARFYALSADVIILGSEDQSITHSENDRNAKGYYKTARDELGYELSPDQTARLANIELRLGNNGNAVAETLQIPEERADLRFPLLKRLIEDHASGIEGSVDLNTALNLIQEVREASIATTEDRLWAIATKADLQIQNGAFDGAIDRLIAELQLLSEDEKQHAGFLFSALGRAYYNSGYPQAARPHLERSLDLLSNLHQDAGRALVVLGRVSMAEEDLGNARDQFLAAIERFPAGNVYVSANLGLAELEATVGHHVRAIEAFQDAISEFSRSNAARDVSRRDIESAIAQQFDRLTLEGANTIALRYADLIEAFISQVVQEDPRVLSRLAIAHAAVAGDIVESLPTNADGLPIFDNTDPVAVQDAKKHYIEAGEYYKRHARSITIANPEQSVDSLWKSADAFDRAGDRHAAATGFTEFIQATNDPIKNVPGLFRLARIYQSLGNTEEAITFFEQILSDHPNTDEAYRSFVPLAQSYLLSGTPEDEERAEERLKAVIDGTFLEPTSPQYRDALIELGLLYRASDRYPADIAYPRAIEYLSQALDRYESAAKPRVLVGIADASRLSARAIDLELQESLPASERVRLSDIRDSRLARAARLYEQVYSQLTDIPQDSRTETQRVQLRAATLYLGDIHFKLAEAALEGSPEQAKHFEQSIRYYDTAVRRYPDEPVSLVALVQIVNAHISSGNLDSALTAQRKAKARLEALADDALTSGDVPMTREHWERWLESSIEIEKLADVPVNAGD